MAASRPSARTADLLDDLAAQLGYRIRQGKNGPVLVQRDGKLAETWRQGYPYEERLARKRYEKEKRRLQIELLKIQRHCQGVGRQAHDRLRGPGRGRQGRDDPAFTENLNPRGARIVALEKPTEQEQSEWYLQRYVATCQPPARS